MEIANKVFIVTGGASGLGASTVRMLVQNGAKGRHRRRQDEPGEAWPRNWASATSIAT